jgi:hypothetical protein
VLLSASFAFAPYMFSQMLLFTVMDDHIHKERTLEVDALIVVVVVFVWKRNFEAVVIARNEKRNRNEVFT